MITSLVKQIILLACYPLLTFVFKSSGLLPIISYDASDDVVVTVSHALLIVGQTTNQTVICSDF